ncbi:cytochrome C oxidase subunit IV family protein [Desulfovibrio ferrophilus]|uniref:Cytochrome c oxidase subunit IV n=1 Tax=Desulfovibrio ferrophilus TaxID=241368 RepID=A0A2Z6AU81_9BACT|nr:cytochrome C oxidase subunit IV family protein [Desulfovibrio ferrophilus]BBD06794.1 cytochrome c oxidase subunit IV [Desulfovibrio ferrophilus]
MNTAEHVPHHGPGYGLLAGIWGLLLVLTWVTVWAAGIDLGYLNVVAALAIATTKASLVILYFMHLKYENWMLKGFVLLTFVILAIFIGLTFFDTAYRGAV